jgi:hypothetical protein
VSGAETSQFEIVQVQELTSIRIDTSVKPTRNVAASPHSNEPVIPTPTVARADLPDISSIPPQITTASQFALNIDGRIDLVADPPDLGVLTDATQREHYEEMRYKAGELFALGHNQLGDLSNPINRFLAASPERVEDVSVTRLWSRGNTLRHRLKIHEATTSADPDPGRLLPTAAGRLRDVVETFNAFIARDPKGRELDHVRLGPQERDTAMAAVQAAVPIVEAVKRSRDIATDAAKEALVEQVDAALSAPAGIDGDRARDLARKTGENFVRRLLGSVLAWIRAEPGIAWRKAREGAYSAGGVAAIIYHQTIIEFVIDNAGRLKAFVEQASHNPTLLHVIELIAKGASS